MNQVACAIDPQHAKARSFLCAIEGEQGYREDSVMCAGGALGQVRGRRPPPIDPGGVAWLVCRRPVRATVSGAHRSSRKNLAGVRP